MYINRVLLLVVVTFLVFSPAIEEWVFHSGNAWYRPYNLWLLLIVAAYWNQRSRYPDEL
jgi:uncharacterized membrane protein